MLEADLSNPKELTGVLDTFFHYAAPDIESFEHAVDDFQESIPDLAQGLLQRIKEEHAKNKAFVAAFSTFLDLCRTSLDPTMSRDTVDEMLVQHLLTERLFRTIFDNDEFTSRNVIAAEIERVIGALTSRAFNRKEFLKSLDRFYVAIENAAKNLDDWAEKQGFLNTVYERFFQGFSTKQADTHGIVYTPQEIVEFMCASVDIILQREFNCSLSTPGVQILDPCTGTGNFIVNLIQRINGGSLAHKYQHDLFCNELMLLPYYIASLNIEHAYYERMGHYQPFEGIVFADTLDLAEGRQLPLFVERNTERVEREKQAPIMVVIGNPPYNVGQKSENDNNKNRKYEHIDRSISETYVKDSKATLKHQLYDAYVRFFRWATDRLQGQDGIVCLVSNNSFLEGITFDGFRKRLSEEFTQIYHFDLGGNARKNGGGNIFGIMVGVGISILVRHRVGVEVKQKTATIYYHKMDDNQNRANKTQLLRSTSSVIDINWQALQPDTRHTWFTKNIYPEFAIFLPLGTKEAKLVPEASRRTIFRTYTNGVKTNRDNWAYGFDYNLLSLKTEQFIEYYNAEVSRWARAGKPKDIDNFVYYDKVKWSEHLKGELKRECYIHLDKTDIRIATYRPFCKLWLYYDPVLNDRPGSFNRIFPTLTLSRENMVIIVSDHGHRAPFSILVTNNIPDYHLLASTDAFQCFPYYTYSEDGTNRRENITDWALTQFQGRYGATVSKWDIFHCVYALLHHPQYRERYAENLKRDLPRIPLLATQFAFETCVRIGKQLMELHLHYEEAQDYPLRWLENKDVSINWRVEKMKLSPAKDQLRVNDWLTLANIPQVCYHYRLGNRSALEWVIDQYQVSTDARSGIVSDPNRDDDEPYIVHLVGKVVTVSVETVKLVEELAQQVKQEEWLGEGL